MGFHLYVDTCLIYSFFKTMGTQVKNTNTENLVRMALNLLYLLLLYLDALYKEDDNV